MPDPIVSPPDATPEPHPDVHPRMHLDRRLHDGEAAHRLTARLTTLDLDPATLEILTAVLNADIDLRSRFALQTEEECRSVR